MSAPIAARPRRRRHRDIGGALLTAFCCVVFLFLLAPLLVLVVTSFTGSDTVAFPPESLSFRWYETLLATLLGEPGTHGGLAASLWFSLRLALLTAAIAVVIGVLAALALNRFSFRGKAVFNGLFLLPLTFPQLVIGVALLLMFSELRLFSSEWFIRLLIGHVVIAVPYVILTVTASLAVYERDLEAAAASLGASPLAVFRLITLPLIMPGIIAGAVFAFITSFTQFTISFFLSFGVSPLPIWLYNLIAQGHDPLLAALSVALIVATVLLVFVIERLIGVRRIFSST